MYLLDKGIFLAILYGNSIVCEKFKQNIKKCYLPSIVTAELYGTIATELLSIESHSSEKDLEIVNNYIEYFPIAKFDLQASIQYGKILRRLKQTGGEVSKVDLIIAATAESLNATVVTHRVRQFESIIAADQIENWRELPALAVTESRPGVLYKVATLLKRLEINIISASMSSNIPDYPDANLLKIKVSHPGDRIYDELKESLRESKAAYRYAHNRQEIQITLELNANRGFEGNSQVNITINGDDRIGLLAEVTRPISARNINIVNANCFASDHRSFLMNFTLMGNQTDWQSLRQEIENIEGMPDVNIRSD